MGSLHAGHRALIDAAKHLSRTVGVSIFVNPTQFGPSEDLARYPRDLEGDLLQCEASGVDWVFAPEPEEIYPPGYATFIEVQHLSEGLCGAKRPGHFRGVATVVAQLLTRVRPQRAFFGEKDFQQLQIVRRLSRDLHLRVDIIGHPIVREPDGLAMSSRNRYLEGEERSRALGLWEGLCAVRRTREKGIRSAVALKRVASKILKAKGVVEDYIEIVDAETLRPLETLPLSSHPVVRLLVAGFVGKVRLIDNVAL